jgi:hypothetical protein
MALGLVLEGFSCFIIGTDLYVRNGRHVSPVAIRRMASAQSTLSMAPRPAPRVITTPGRRLGRAGPGVADTIRPLRSRTWFSSG